MSNTRNVKRIYLNFAPNIRIRFVGRDLAIQRVIEWAEEGMWKPAVILVLRDVEKLPGLNSQ